MPGLLLNQAIIQPCCGNKLMTNSSILSCSIYPVFLVDQPMFFMATLLRRTLVLVYFHGIFSHYLSNKFDWKPPFAKDCEDYHNIAALQIVRPAFNNTFKIF
ncbi:hypothetical protein BH11BAC3_BH11BAC3_03530 [soil metagenome]